MYIFEQYLQSKFAENVQYCSCGIYGSHIECLGWSWPFEIPLYLYQGSVNKNVDLFTVGFIVKYIEITSWLVSAYDFYSRVVKDR